MAVALCPGCGSNRLRSVDAVDGAEFECLRCHRWWTVTLGWVYEVHHATGHTTPRAAPADPLRIGVIAPPWIPVPPPAYGGTERVIDVLVRGLVRSGHEVLLVTTGDATCPVPRPWLFPQAFGTQEMLFHREFEHVAHAYEVTSACDIVHDHTQLGPLLGHHLAGPPTVTTNHGLFAGASLSLYRAVADTVPVIAISRHQRSTAPDLPIAAVIHHGMDVESTPVGTGRGGYLAFVGRMSPDKGLRTAIAVARASGVPLRIAAKMWEPDEVRFFDESVRPLLGKEIEYVGELSDVERSALLGDALALLNPIAWDEPFGLVMIEALACGTPVITTRRGSAPEIVDDGVTGAVCDDQAALAAAVATIDRVDRRACRTSAERRFSADRMVGEHVDLYRRILAGAVGAHGQPVRSATTPAPRMVTRDRAHPTGRVTA